ncbi:hypothetical protein L226DRAFT_562081 [Lentinus tigrinus ALCF2SS1-7]|uniref:Cyclin N-terminal domain-containing protein n=1 Tax=Lentinus tigrinus ALCF2SS1-6 TaxID=1328759 RepID=A0A5C2S2Q3_9APHY|nr:hypothetical protein L227DRAFT_655314 [Lentinus tigrinus ALCF2SS1-6]RPD71873.1 hypothetical protein L226DRAFT_562081 [Lentinus tigrinus ALCF2SS1-7]
MSSTSSTAQSSRSLIDPSSGHDETARLCARFVMYLFEGYEVPPPSTKGLLIANPNPLLPLTEFVAYALHQTQLHHSVAFAALYHLYRLKNAGVWSAIPGSSGHTHVITALIIAYKRMCDKALSNKTWSTVAHDLFSVHEINQMEQKMLNCLQWRLKVAPKSLQQFEQKVRHDFKGFGPYTFHFFDPNPVLPDPAPGITVPGTPSSDVHQQRPVPPGEVYARAIPSVW